MDNTEMELSIKEIISDEAETLPNDPPKPIKVSGSFLSSYVLDIIASFIAKSTTIIMIIPLAGMPELSPLLKGILVVSPLIPNLFIPIPMTLLINKSGGKKEGIGMMSVTLAGMTILTILSACTDLDTIKSFDGRYFIMLAAGYLIGHSSAVPLLMMDALKWVSKKNYIPNLQLLFSFLADTSSIITPLVAYFASPLHYYIPFSIYTGLVLVGGVMSLGLTSSSPYYQFRKKFSHLEAKQLAIEAGQLEELIKNYDDVTLWSTIKENLSVLYDRRSLLLMFSMFCSWASFFVSRTILPEVLIGGFNLTPSQSIIISTIANLITLGTRPITSKAIEYFDKESGGVRIHIFGCILAMIGASALAIPREIPLWDIYPALAMNNCGFGINMVTTMSIAAAWSRPTNQSLPKVNPSTIFGLFGTIGVLGGTILPILIGLLVDGKGTQWYQQYFYFILVMMLVSAIGVPIIDYQVKRKPDESLFKSTLSFFGRACPTGSQQSLLGNHTSVIANMDDDDEDEDRIYVDAFF